MKPSLAARVDFVDVEAIPVRANRDGFWDGEFPTAPARTGCRIAFLGDSFTWGMAVREEERFSAVIEARRPGWDTLNFGIPGYGTDQSLLAWRHVAARIRPRLAVLTVYQNDYGDNLHAVRYGRAKPYFALAGDRQIVLRNVPVAENDFWRTGLFNQAAPPYAALFARPSERRSPLLHWTLKYSDAARLAYTATRLRWGRAAASAAEEGTGTRADPTASRPVAPDPRQAVEAELLLAEVRTLAREVRAAGAEFLLVLAGDRIAQVEHVARAFCRDGEMCVDATTPVLARRARTGAAPIYYPYCRHWTAAAHAAVAALLVEGIDRAGVCSEGAEAARGGRA
jgi:hypothetical protein